MQRQPVVEWRKQGMLAFVEGKVNFETIVLHEIRQDIPQIRDAPAALGVQPIYQYADFAVG